MGSSTSKTPKLSERLRAWAHNEEMIDTGFTQHGLDLLEAAELLDKITEEALHEQWTEGYDHGFAAGYDEATA